jgi:hypothetical protein
MCSAEESESIIIVDKNGYFEAIQCEPTYLNVKQRGFLDDDFLRP